MSIVELDSHPQTNMDLYKDPALDNDVPLNFGDLWCPCWLAIPVQINLVELRRHLVT